MCGAKVRCLSTCVYLVTVLTWAWAILGWYLSSFVWYNTQYFSPWSLHCKSPHWFYNSAGSPQLQYVHRDSSKVAPQVRGFTWDDRKLTAATYSDILPGLQQGYSSGNLNLLRKLDYDNFNGGCLLEVLSEIWSWYIFILNHSWIRSQQSWVVSLVGLNM